jgi:hypothetical protein
MHFPDPIAVRPEFERRGFLLADVLDPDELSVLFDVAFRLVRRHSAHIDRAESGKRLRYDVVSGDRIASEGGPLFALYTHPDLLAWVRAVTGSPMLAPSTHLRSSINVNCLHTAGQRYPWHRDAVPYTALLFLASVPLEAGGTLLIRAGDASLASVQPRSGCLVFMDGTRCEHAISPLTEDTLRLSVPMVYPATAVDRPAGLDDFLYGA